MPSPRPTGSPPAPGSTSPVRADALLGRGRLRSLDGLRGLAAVVVVVFHAMIVNPGLAEVAAGRAQPSATTALLTLSPVRLLWAGEEAVMVFFVLSGFVLTLPFLGGRLDVLDYYPRRLLRIYLPVWASVALALGWRALVPRTSSTDFSWWTNGHAAAVTLQGLLGDSTLVIGTTWLNSVLWSLKWEVWFSLLLPAFLWAFVRRPRFAVVKVAALLATSQLGATWHVDVAHYLPVFGLGVVLAVELSRRSLGPLRGSRAVGLTSVALLLILAEPLTGGRWELTSVVALGAVALIVVFVGWNPARRLGEQCTLQYLGRISFSLYLTHEPVVVSAALVTGSTNPAVVLLAAAPVALVVAHLFNRLVEGPAHRAARWSGHRLVAFRESLRRPRPGAVPGQGPG